MTDTNKTSIYLSPERRELIRQAKQIDPQATLGYLAALGAQAVIASQSSKWLAVSEREKQDKALSEMTRGQA